MVGFSHLAQCFQVSIMWQACISTPLYGCNTFIYSSVGGHLVCCHFFAIMNDGAITFVQRFFGVDVCFHFLEYTPMNGFARSYGNSETASLFFQSGSTILHFHQHCMIPVFPHPHQYFSSFFYSQISLSLKWYLIAFVCFWSTVDLQCCVSVWCTA